MLLLDTSHDPRAVLSQARSAGLDAGAVAVYTDDGGAGAFVATPQVVRDLLAAGVAVLPIFNGATVNSGDPSRAGGDAAQAVKELQALGVPQGCAVAYDIERVADAIITPAYLVGVVQALLDGGWVPLVYCSARDPQFSFRVLDGALQAAAATMAKAQYWLASWKAQGDPPQPAPDWSDPLGPAGLPWQPIHQGQVTAWQYQSDVLGGAADLSVTRPPLDGVLWSPPKPAPTYIVPATYDPSQGGVLIPCTFGGPKGSADYTVIVDTGDELGPTFPQEIADALGLPNLGSLTISGATGTGTAFWTSVDVTLAGRTWKGVRGAVDPEYQGKPLLGLPFFLQVGKGLELDFAQGLLRFGG
jgi:hypothetical protein